MSSTDKPVRSLNWCEKEFDKVDPEVVKLFDDNPFNPDALMDSVP